MKKLRTLLTLIVVSVCALQSAWARIAPTLPEGVAPVSGQAYYLYNVVEGKFLCQSSTNNSYAGIGDTGLKVTVTATENEGEYTLQWYDTRYNNNEYLYAIHDNYVYSSSSASNYKYFQISLGSNGYTIQRSPSNTQYYQANEFVGYDGSNGDRVNPSLTEGSIYWLFLPVDEAEHYFAKLKLYNYLEESDGYDFYVADYEDVYENPASTTDQLNEAQETLGNALSLSNNYTAPSWAEYSILFQNTTENKWKNSSGKLEWNPNADGTTQTSTLKATVVVSENATLAYTYGGYPSGEYCVLNVKLDGEVVQSMSFSVIRSERRRYYIEVPAGRHDVEWVVECATRIGSSSEIELSEIGFVNTPTITPATTTVEGQLGTEVLKLVDPVSSVRKIIINGVIGADDWTTIGLMVNAFTIDMSGATAVADIPASMFTKTKYPFLHSVKLPQGLTAIGESAFVNSDIEDEITFPETLKSIGSSAFKNSKIRAAYMPDGVTSVGSGAFEDCYFLEKATYPSATGNIPSRCFYDCRSLRSFKIPEGIAKIGSSAFYEASLFNPRFPSTMTLIEPYAFYQTATDSLFVIENMRVERSAFGDCPNLVYAEWPTTFAAANGYGSSNGTNPIVPNCSNLNKVVFKSPTVVTLDQQHFFDGITRSNITLLVPDFLESSYKLTPYWSDCKVVGFESSEITDWQISNPLELSAAQRIGGTPNLYFKGGSRLIVNGDATQTIGDMNIDFCPVYFYYYKNGYGYSYAQRWGMMLGRTDNSVTDNVNITGELSENVYTDDNTWYFLTLPFDTKVSDITTESLIDGAVTSYAIRYYDGASRAANGTGGNWKNYAQEDVIPAGTGFIYQTAKAAKSKFVSQDNATKQYILSNKVFAKTLVENPSEVTANKGWNLVGNPWQTYYNIHKLNFTAPITVWDMSNSKYVAYSIIDDDYAIKPLEAIFVQCPDEVNSISFPIDGKQLTDVIESQSGARALQPSERKLIDVELSDGKLTDKTRFVLNPKASLSYEVNCDASKFMSMDASVPQLYTIEQSNLLAINERPLGDGIVQLGFKVAADGTYTISAPRNQFESIVLADAETGVETDLSKGSYTFTANAGSNNSRFVLRVGGVIITSVSDALTVKSEGSASAPCYNLNGQRVSQPQKGLYIVNGKKVLK